MKSNVLKNGFTLLELVVVIIVIGILAGVAIRAQDFLAEKSRGLEATAILQRAYSGYQRLRVEGVLEGYCDGESYPFSWSLFQMGDPNADNRRLFQYSISAAGTNCSGTHRAVTATRRVGGATVSSQNLTIDLVSGSLSKSAEY